LEHLERLVADGSYKPSPGERVELGLYVSAREQAKADDETYGGDAA
jgi:hypothetical protein